MEFFSVNLYFLQTQNVDTFSTKQILLFHKEPLKIYKVDVLKHNKELYALYIY